MNRCLARADRYEPTMMRCATCNLAWDTGDTEKPVCPRTVTLVPDERPVILGREPAVFVSGLPDPICR